MKVDTLKGRLAEITSYLRGGGILVDLLAGTVDEETLQRLLRTYEETWLRMEDTRAQLETEIEAEKQRFKNEVLEMYQSSGEVRAHQDGMSASVRVSKTYDPIEASAILRNHDLYETAISEGILSTELKVATKKVKGVYSELLEPALQRRVSSVVVKVHDDD